MQRVSKPLFLLLLVLLASLWTACSATRDLQPPSEVFSPADAGGAAAPAVEATPIPQAAGAAGTAGLTSVRKIIATADITLIVTDTDVAVAQIEELVKELGGYVSDANLYKSSVGDTELRRGSLTLRVPAERLDEAVERLQAIAVDVRNWTLNRQDVTEQYSDIEAQLRNLKATEKELRALLAEVRAKPNATPDDILAVYRSLTDIRGQIEQIQGRKNVLDNQIGFSTIRIELIPDAVNRPIVEAQWRPALVARNALRALMKTLQLLVNFLIWIGLYFVPLLLLVLIPLAVLFWLIRRRRKRKPGFDGEG